MGDINRTPRVDVLKVVRGYWATPAWCGRFVRLVGQAALFALLLTAALTGVGAWAFVAYVHSAASEMGSIWASVVTGLIGVTPEQVNALDVLALGELRSALCWSFLLFFGLGAFLQPVAHSRRTRVIG